MKFASFSAFGRSDIFFRLQPTVTADTNASTMRHNRPVMSQQYIEIKIAP